MPNIKPFRQYDEAEVINAFKCDTVPSNKGTFVKIATGWKNNEEDLTPMLGAIGNSYLGTVSQRYGVVPSVDIATSGNRVFGMLLYDVKETDENGEQLKFNPRKAAEMQCAISGQAVPILKRGLVLYSGIEGTPTGGASAYLSDTATDGSLATTSAGGDYSVAKVGSFLGEKDTEGYAFLYVDCRG